MEQKVTGKIVDILNKKIFDGEVIFDEGKIIAVNPLNLPFREVGPSTTKPLNYILPGFIDSHVHIESSCLCLPNLQDLLWCMAP